MYYLVHGHWHSSPPFVDHEYVWAWEGRGNKSDWVRRQTGICNFRSLTFLAQRDFMKVSSLRLACLEICDCWRESGGTDMKARA